MKVKQIPFEPTGQEGYYHLTDHDSLVIVAAGTGHYQTDTFFWNSRGLSGNLYCFITGYMGVPKGHFVDEVLATLGNDAGPEGDLITKEETAFDERQWPDSGYHQRVTALLEAHCHFPTALVNRLFDLDFLRQLANGEGVLMWRDHRHKIVGASQLIEQDDRLRTRTSRDAKHYYGFNFGYHYQEGGSYTLLVFEDPLRALAYYRLLVKSNAAGAYRFLSVGGSATRLPAIVNYIQDWGCPQTIRLCVDNSDAGLIMAAKFYADYDGEDDQVTLLIDKRSCQVKISFDQAAASAGNFIQQNATQAAEPQVLTYHQLLDTFDQSREAGAAQHLLETTPGMGQQGEQPTELEDGDKTPTFIVEGIGDDDRPF